MSAGPAVAPVLLPTARTAPPASTAPPAGVPLVLLPAPVRRPPFAPYAVLLAGLMLLGLLSLLMLNTVLAQDAFRLHDLQGSTVRLAEQEERLVGDLDRALSPAGLAESGRALGMVPAPAPVFLRLDDGAVLGVPTAALAPPPPPAPVVRPPVAVEAAAAAASTPDPTDSTSEATPGSDQ